MRLEKDFSNYGKSFQETLAQLILEDRPFCDQMEEVLDVNFFELKYLKLFVAKIIDYRARYKVHPTGKILASILRTEIEDENEAVQKQVRDYFSRTLINRVSDVEYVKDTSLDFCKKQKLKEAMIRSASLLQNSSFDEIRTVIDSALKLGTDNNFGHDFKKDFEARYQLKARNPVSTGWEQIDGITRQGLGKGELGVVIAPTGAGKSMVLAHLGVEALKAGKNVVHYTLELAEATTGHRYDSCISGVSLSDLFAFKQDVYESCLEVDGELIIKEYPTKTASPNTLRAHLEKLRKKDHDVDVIIVDYADLLRSNTKYTEKRIELESIYEDLRGLAQEFNCPIWTASQTNRSGLNAEVVTMESISEAFNKCFVADFICSLSRTVKDKQTDGGRIFVAKNRNGPDGIVFPIFMDPSRVKIKVIDPLQANQSVSKTPAKDQMESLKEKYIKHRKGEKNAATK
tara:strand:+ start:5071 stop:6444 length:1374 start_codon:yes stop_codon:yes gene_type:complete